MHLCKSQNITKMKYILILAVIIIAFLFSCEKDILQQSEPEELIVTEAYLYEGEPVDDIYLASLLVYGGEDTIVQTIPDAEIVIIHNGNPYQLVPSDSAGYYYFPGTDLEITVGENYQIEIYYFNKTTFAETTVPFPPTGVTISEEMIYIDPTNIKEYWINMSPVEINWDESGNDYSYVLVENIEDEPVDIFSGRKVGGFRKITLPVQGNSYTFLPLEVVQQWGTHLIRVFRVNKEYADLYESMDQDSRDLNEPLSNITNGLGIFTAFSCDSIYLEIVPQ